MPHSKLRLTSLATAAVFALATLGGLSACAADGSSAPGTSKVSILLTDAPGDVKKAVVTISQIYLQGSDDEQSGRVVLLNTPVTTDLLTLANSTAELVNDAVVPAGTYSQLRFVVTGGYIEVDDGHGGTSIYASSPDYAGLPAGAPVAGQLKMPSYAQTGIKVNLPDGGFHVSGEQKVLLVDFDVARSFGHQAGASGMWVMTPVLTATELTATGSVVVTLRKDAAVTLPTIGGTATTLGGFSAELSNGAGSHETTAFTDADGDGTYEAAFRFLVPGGYTLDVTGPAGVTFTTNPAHPASVSIASGQASSFGFTVTAASATP
jgi:hypothetical protein